MTLSVDFKSIFSMMMLGLAACSGSTEPKSSTENESAKKVSAASEAGEVNVYSGRHYDADRVLFDRFAEETGIKVNLIEAKGDALIERMAREGEASPADLFITADAGILWRADQRDLFQPIQSEDIMARAPEQFQHPDNHWVGVSKRARIVIYNKEAGLPEGVADYLDLSREDLKGTICVRSSSNIYNQSLLASIIANHGEDKAQEWANGVVANFARSPEGNDTAQIEAVAAGICRIAIVNSYYLARFVGVDDPEKMKIAAHIGVLFPSQETTGAHVNISGAGVTRYAANRENAEALIAFLLRDDIQGAFALINNEYPIVTGVEASGPITELGDFVEDDLPVVKLGEHQSEAVKTFDRAGWL